MNNQIKRFKLRLQLNSWMLGLVFNRRQTIRRWHAASNLHLRRPFSGKAAGVVGKIRDGGVPCGRKGAWFGHRQRKSLRWAWFVSVLVLVGLVHLVCLVHSVRLVRLVHSVRLVHLVHLIHSVRLVCLEC